MPVSRPGWRRSLGTTVSVVLHVVLVALLLNRAARNAAADPVQVARATERPVQLDFAPPRPVETPRPQPAELPPAVPLTPGPDQTPGTEARVSPTPEPAPNAPPTAPRQEAFRPDPGDDDVPRPSEAAPTPPASIAAPTPTTEGEASPTLESEAQRIFGRPSSKLGPVSGSQSVRPWESPVGLDSRGCSLPEPEEQDSTLPKGMAAIAGRIYRQDNGRPLAGARLQILGTPYGTFANDRGEYRLVFDRKLVDRCRTQSVRVSAPGYEQRDVLLFIGETPNGDVALPRRH